MDITNIRIDFDEITLGDFEDFEEATGKSLQRFIDELEQAKQIEQLPVRELRALLWVFGRKDNPELTFEATRDIKLSDFTNLLVTRQAEPREPRQTASQKRAAKRQTAKAG